VTACPDGRPLKCLYANHLRSHSRSGSRVADASPLGAGARGVSASHYGDVIRSSYSTVLPTTRFGMERKKKT